MRPSQRAKLQDGRQQKGAKMRRYCIKLNSIIHLEDCLAVASPPAGGRLMLDCSSSNPFLLPDPDILLVTVFSLTLIVQLIRERRWSAFQRHVCLLIIMEITPGS